MAVDFNTKIPMLIARELSGQELTNEESTLLDDWIAASDANRDLYHKMLSGESWKEHAALAQQIDGDLLLQRITTRGKQRKIRRMFRGAAAAAAVLLVASLVFWRLDKMPASVSTAQEVLLSRGSAKAILTVGTQRVELTANDTDTAWARYAADAFADDHAQVQAVPTVRIETPKGGEYAVRLADGTQVRLNAGTVIEYPQQFADADRTVRVVAGEAFFAVAKDTKRPFFVQTADQLAVKVFGTRFNVRNYPDESDVEVALVEGSVAMEFGHKQVRMKPNQLATFQKTDHQIAVAQVEDMRCYTAWVDGHFYYKEATLSQILKGLERWYDIEIDYSSVKGTDLGEATLIFNRKDNLHTVLEALKTMSGLQYEISKTNKRVIIIKNI